MASSVVILEFSRFERDHDMDHRGHPPAILPRGQGDANAFDSFTCGLRRLFADGDAEEKLRQALVSLGTWPIGIIKRSDTAEGLRCCRDDG